MNHKIGLFLCIVPAPQAVGLRALLHVLQAVPAEVGAAVRAVHVVAAALLLDRALARRAWLHVHPGREEVQGHPLLGPARRVPHRRREGVYVPRLQFNRNFRDVPKPASTGCCPSLFLRLTRKMFPAVLIRKEVSTRWELLEYFPPQP